MSESIEPVIRPLQETVDEPERSRLMPLSPVIDEPAPGPGGVLRGPLTLIRFLIRRAIWLVIRLLRGIWRYPIAALGLVLIVFLAHRGYQDYIVTKPPPPVAPHFDMAEAIPPPDSVLQYLKGEQSFDVQGMWDNYSAVAKQNSLQQGISLDLLQSYYQALRQQGIHFGNSTYIGGYRATGGNSYYFYVTRMTGPGGSLDIYQTFVVDPDGKVLVDYSPQLDNLIQNIVQNAIP